MKNTIPILLFSVLFFVSCSNPSRQETNNKSESICKDTNCKDKSKTVNAPLSCKLTTPEMDKRKATVLESLRKQIIEQKELPNGYAYKFNGSDKMIDELTDFAKTERHCCDFFTFNIAITGDSTSLWFEITGPKEAKQFIKSELEL